MFLEFLTLALFGCASPAAYNRSTTEAEHNWKFVWLEAKYTDYVQSTEPLQVDLNAFTISMWVKDTKGNTVLRSEGSGRGYTGPDPPNMSIDRIRYCENSANAACLFLCT